MFVDFIYYFHVLKYKHIKSVAIQNINNDKEIFVKFLKSLSIYQFLGTLFCNSLKQDNHVNNTALLIINCFLK